METRITLGKIESLVGNREVSHIGRATFGRKNSSSKVLTITLPSESRKVEMPEEAPFYNPLDGRFDEDVQREASIKYISCVESFLRKEGLYLAEAFYRPHGLFLDFPRSEKLEGDVLPTLKVFLLRQKNPLRGVGLPVDVFTLPLSKQFHDAHPAF